ncbi:MFS transporter [Janibacter sp. GS2]|uniref:MFS transporter n=1 Tax=Janibacter sp. GS2 TaxID=3442646 RepID=UPI003EBC49D2
MATNHPTAVRSVEDRDAERTTPTGTSARSWAIVALLLVFFTLNFADKAAIGLAAGEIKEDLGLSESQYGLVSSAFFWLFAVGAVVLTLWFKRVGYLFAGAALMTAWGLSMLPLTVPTTFGVLIASRVVLGFFEGPAHALCQSIVADRFPPEKRAFAGAVVNAGSSIGPLIAAPTLTWVILTWSWHASFMALIAIGVVWTVVWLLVVRGEPGMRRQTRSDVLGTATTGQVHEDGDIDVPLTSLLKTGSFWGLAMLSFAGYLISSLKVAWLPSFLGDGMGYSPSAVGWLVTLPYLAAVVVLLTAGLLSGHLLRRGFSSHVARGWLTTAYLVFAGVCMIAFTQVSPGRLQLVLVVCAFAINSVAFSVAFAGAADFLPSRHRPGFFGCIIAAYSVAGIVAPYVLGVIVDAGATVAEGYANGFLIVGLTICVFAVIGGYLLDPARSRAALVEETRRRRESSVL